MEQVQTKILKINLSDLDENRNSVIQKGHKSTPASPLPGSPTPESSDLRRSSKIVFVTSHGRYYSSEQSASDVKQRLTKHTSIN